MCQSAGEIDDEKHRQRILERIDFSASQAPAISDPGTADDAAATGAGGGGGGGGAGVGGGNGGISYFERIMLKKNRRQVNGTTSKVNAGECGVCVDGRNTPQNTSHNSTTLEVTYAPRVYTVYVCTLQCRVQYTFSARPKHCHFLTLQLRYSYFRSSIDTPHINLLYIFSLRAITLQP